MIRSWVSRRRQRKCDVETARVISRLLQMRTQTLVQRRQMVFTAGICRRCGSNRLQRLRTRSWLERSIRREPAIGRSHCPREKPIHAILKHNTLVIPFAVALRFYTVIASGAFLSTLDASLPTSCDKAHRSALGLSSHHLLPPRKPSRKVMRT